MWDKCALSVLSIVCRTHLSHFQFIANMNVYEHIGHTSWDKCAPRQMCSYSASSVLSIVCRTHLSHFQFIANMNVYEHIGHTSWDKCAPRQMCSYRASIYIQVALYVRTYLIGQITANQNLLNKCSRLISSLLNYSKNRLWFMENAKSVTCISLSLRISVSESRTIFYILYIKSFRPCKSVSITFTNAQYSYNQH
jgi:hypothetical protein